MLAANGLGEGSGEAELLEAEGVLHGLRMLAVVYPEEKVCVCVRVCSCVCMYVCMCVCFPLCLAFPCCACCLASLLIVFCLLRSTAGDQPLHGAVTGYKQQEVTSQASIIASDYNSFVICTLIMLYMYPHTLLRFDISLEY